MKYCTHIINTFCRCLLFSLLLVISLIGPAAAQTYPTDRDLFDFPDSVDVFFAYYPDSDQAVLLAPASGIEIIVLALTPFEQVDQSAIDPSAWQTVDSVVIWPGDTVVLRRSAGEIVKLAFMQLSTGDVPPIQVTYAPVPSTLPDPSAPTSVVLRYYEGLDLDSGNTFSDPTVASVILCDDTPPIPTPTPTPGVIPEPGTGILFLAGILGLLGSWLLARRNRTTCGSNRKKWWFFLLLLSIVLLSVSGAELIVAQQSCILTVDKQGSGTGTVLGRGIDCGTDCTVSPLEGGQGGVAPGEVINLKAIPDDGSVFVGWFVDGLPYQGIFRMTGDTTLTAIFGNAPNSPPIAEDDAYSTTEDEELTISAPGVLNNDSDPDGDALSAVLVDGPSHGSLTLNPDGAFTYLPETDFNGADQFTYRASDGDLESADATVTITIMPVNEAPVAVNDAYSTDEDVELQVPASGVLSNDSDPDGDALNAAIVNDPSHGSLTLNPDGSFVYLPDPDFSGVDQFVYRVTDGDLESAIAVVTITVTGSDDVPVADDLTVETVKNRPVVITLQGHDGDDDPLTYQIVEAPEHGTLSGTDNNFTYTPETDFVGPDTFTYLVNDGTSDSNIATVTISVRDVDLVIGVIDVSNTTLDPQTLSLAGTITVTFENAGSEEISDPYEIQIYVEDQKTDTVTTLGTATISTPLTAGNTLTVNVSINGTILFKDQPVYAFVDSQDVIMETDEENNLAHNMVNCAIPPAEPGSFDPVLEWEWTGSEIIPGSYQVTCTPVVANLTDDNGDGTIDVHDIPDIIFISHKSGSYGSNGIVRAISGDGSGEIFSITDPAYETNPSTSPAVGDIDGDGLVEIIAAHEQGTLIAFEHDGTFKWLNTATLSQYDGAHATPAIADLDQDGVPEIIAGHVVVNHDGITRWVGYYGGSGIDCVANLDLEGSPEVVVGDTAYRADGEVYWHNVHIRGGGYPAVGNFDDDPYPEIVVIGSYPGYMYVYLVEHNGSLIWSKNIRMGGPGGPPTIADFDNDGQPEIGVAGNQRYYVFEGDGGWKWSYLISDPSGFTGSSVFDFEGDGRAEAVYADKNYLRIFDGTDGTVLFQEQIGARTRMEYPVIADVDNDNNAEIVVVGSNDWHGWDFHGIKVFGDASDTWVNTRKIWNQHAYHVTNVNDDGTIPQFEANSWEVHNTYRCNLIDNPLACEDYSASYIRVDTTDFPNSATIIARIGNAGIVDLAVPLDVAFYHGNPQAGGTLIGTATLDPDLSSGFYEDVTYTWEKPPEGFAEIYVVVDDDGSGTGTIRESDEINNKAGTTLFLGHYPVADAGAYQHVLQNTLVVLDGSGSYDPYGNPLIYHWSIVDQPDGSTAELDDPSSVNPTFLPAQPGRYRIQLVVENSLGAHSAIDQVIVVVVPHIVTENTPPIAEDDVYTTAENVVLQVPAPGVLANDTDGEGDQLHPILTVNPAHGSVTLNLDGSFSYLPNLNFFGIDEFIYQASDGREESAETTVSILMPHKENGRTYTVDTDFAEGELFNLDTSVSDHMQISNNAQQLPLSWLSISTKGTVVKMNTRTGEILGEYYAAPDGQPNSPTNPTIDHNGNVWVANSDGNSVVQIGLVEAGQCIDRNGDGKITTSTGLDDVLAWTNAGGVDTDGGVSTAEDECLLQYVRTTAQQASHLSVDHDNHLWVGGYTSYSSGAGRHFDRIDSRTGTIVRTETGVGYGGVRGLLDRQGILWSANKLLRWDPTLPLTGPNGVNWQGYHYGSIYDSQHVALDSQGYVWCTALDPSKVRKYAPDGTLVRTYELSPFCCAGTIAIDHNDHVWEAHPYNRSTVRHLLNNGTYIGSVSVGNGPASIAVDRAGKIWVFHTDGTIMRIDPTKGPIRYGHPLGEVEYISPYVLNARMNGYPPFGAPDEGNWVAVFDSELKGAQWGKIEWNGRLYGDGKIEVSVTSSEDQVNFSPPVSVCNGEVFSVPDGRYLRIHARFTRASTGESPVLEDLSVGTTGYVLPGVQNAAPHVEAGDDRRFSLPSTSIDLDGLVFDDCLPGCTPVTMSWNKDSGPGDVSFSQSESSDTTATFDETGVYVLRLSADDGEYAIEDTLTVTVKAGNTAPVVSDDDYAVGENLALDIPAPGVLGNDTDAEGDPLRVILVSDPSHGSLTLNADGSFAYLPEADFIGTDQFIYHVDDGEVLSGNGIVTITVDVPPVADAGADQTVILGSTVSLDGSGSSDPNNQIPLTYQWSFIEQPAGSSTNLDDPSRVDPECLPDLPGTYVLQVIVTNSLGVSSSPDLVTITVKEPNVPPTVAIGYPTTNQQVRVGETLTIQVQAADADGSVTTVEFYQGTTLLGEETSAPYEIDWTPTETDLGQQTLTATAYDNDGDSSTSAPITVEVLEALPDMERPAVTLTVTPSVANAGGTVTITVDATDNVAVVSKTLTVDGVDLPLDAAGQATYTSATAGIFLAEATALDAAGNEGYASQEFRFLEPGDPTAPTVEIVSPEELAKLYVPTEIIGTVEDDNLLRYTLEYSQKDQNVWIVFATGDIPVNNGVLGTLDTTLMQNGLYDIRLTAEDESGNLETVETIYQIDGNMKIGIFTLTFTDLTIPVSGIPITVTRTYDSRNAHIPPGPPSKGEYGDFGIGWTMGVSDIRIEESEVPGEGWYQVSQGGGSILNPFVTYYLQETIEHKVTVTYPGGQTDEFRMNVIPTSSFLQPFDQVNVSFEPLAGTHSTLEAIGDSLLWVVGNVDAPVTLTDDNYVTYNPNRYKLTTLDGTVFVIDQDSGIETVTDRNGNTLTFGPNGIEHSTGKSVQFVRDAENRIERITDPMGRTIEYGYDAYGDLISVTDQQGYVTRFTYNNRHDLLDIIDPRGVRATRNEYDESGRLVATIDPDGHRIEFDHDIDARMEVVRDRLGYPTIIYYDDHGNVLREVDALGNTKEYTYDERDNLLTEQDQLGYSTVSTYNAQDLMTSKTNPVGYTVEASYNTRAQVLTLQDVQGLLLENTYDANGNLKQITEATGATSGFGYNPAGRPTSYADQIGKVMLFTYNTDGNVLTMTDPEGTLISFNYDDNGNVLSKTSTRTTPTGTETLTTINVYDHLGRMVENVDAGGHVSKVEYNAIGKQAAYIDKRGYRTEYVYDDLGNLERVSYPDGTEESFTYDAEGRNISSMNREGKETVYTYDKLGRLIKTEAPDGSYTETVYDERGQVEKQINERGNETSYTYDAAGRNTEVKNALNQITWYNYALDGKLTRMRDANNHITRYEYDANGRRIKTIFHDDSYVETKYDDAGRVTDEWDQNRQHTGYAYDWRGKLTKVIDALNNETTFEYDEVGNMIAITDAEQQTTRFEYDNLGRMTKRILPLDQEETMVYDGEDNLMERTDFNGQTTTFQYDSDGRVTKKMLPDRTVDYVYALDGSQKTITDSRGTTTSNYDEMGRLESQINPDGSTISYGYDNAGNRTQVTTPSGTVTYTFDALNRLETTTDPATGTTTYTYDDVGNLKTVTYPNGTVAEYTYDALNRLTYLENRTSGGTVISSYTYTLDAAGNRTKVVEHTGRTVEYTYDDIYKLLEEKITNPDSSVSVISYTYDAVGNRLTKTENGFTTTYVYDDNNRLVQEDDVRYYYDDNGNLVEKDSAEEDVLYFYDHENHLIRVETTRFGVTIVVEYEYDDEGNRVRKVIDGTVVINYLVDANRDYAQVLEERDGNGNLLVRYVYGHDLISQTRGGATTYYHYDGLGSTRALTSSAEVVTDTYTYDAFGNLLDKTGTTTNDYLYTGEFFDANIGFYYLRARYMNPAIGRFVTMDTFAGRNRDPYSLHKYLYAHANPVNRVDPSGYGDLKELNVGTLIVGILSRIAIVAFHSTVLGTTTAGAIYATDFRPIEPREIQLSQEILGRFYNGHEFVYNDVMINDLSILPFISSHSVPEKNIYIAPGSRPIFGDQSNKSTFIHEMFHQFQYMALPNKPFKKLLFEQLKYWTSFHYYDPYMNDEIENYVWGRPSTLNNITRLNDIPTLEGQATFVEYFAFYYLWWKRLGTSPYYQQRNGLRKCAQVLSNSGLRSDAIKLAKSP